MAIEITGKTIDAAIAAALKQLGADRDSVTYEVLEMPKSGFLGIGGAPAKVRVKRLDEPEEKPVPPKPPAPPPVKKKKEAEKPREDKAATARPPSAPSKKAAPKKAPAEIPKERTKKETPAETPKKTPAAASGNAKEILKGILDRMGIPGAVIVEKETERGLLLEVSGSNMGKLIGKRGETLDAVQRVLSSAVNKGASERRRVMIDAEKYRAKREDALETLARTTAEKVVKYNRDILLEPMNSYSRHIIHLALQDNPYVTTHSAGNEPHRRVIISLSGAKKTAEPRREKP